MPPIEMLADTRITCTLQFNESRHLARYIHTVLLDAKFELRRALGQSPYPPVERPEPYDVYRKARALASAGAAYIALDNAYNRTVGLKLRFEA